jgi:hypothetical protein
MHFVAVEDMEHVSGRQPCEVWEITAEEWHREKRPR